MSRKNEIDCLKRTIELIKNNKNNIYSNCDVNIVLNLLLSAKENENNNFPDFVFENGGIEHFELTSSKETKKGSEFKIQKSENDKKILHECVNSKKIMPNNDSPYYFTVNTFYDKYDSFSYTNFINSIRKNIGKHVISLNNNKYQNKEMIFLMEQQTSRMYNSDNGCIAGFYELHRDKNTLSIIKDICTGVHYLIYFVADSIEIIDLTKIDDLINKSIVYNKIDGGRLIYPTLEICIHFDDKNKKQQ